MTKQGVDQDHIIKTKGSHIQISQDRTQRGILILSGVVLNKFLIKEGIKTRECTRIQEEVIMSNNGSMMQEANTLTHVKDLRCTLARVIQIDRGRGNTLKGTSIQTQGSFQTSIATGVQHLQASRDTLAILTLIPS